MAIRYVILLEANLSTQIIPILSGYLYIYCFHSHTTFIKVSGFIIITLFYYTNTSYILNEPYSFA